MYCAGEAGMPQCHCGMVSHYLGAENRRAGLLCYAIAADCITEGKGDVRRMKCSHIKNAASLFPLTCGCVWQVFSMSQNRFLQRQMTCLIISLCVHLCIGIFSLFKDQFGQRVILVQRREVPLCVFKHFKSHSLGFCITVKKLFFVAGTGSPYVRGKFRA